MKSIVFLLAMGLALTQAHSTHPRISKESDCKCFASFKPAIEEYGPDKGFYTCSSDKVNQRFDCGEEQPPACQCKEDGKTLTLEIGVLDCTSTKQGHYRCLPYDIWDQYFEKHPEYQIFD